MSQPLNLAKPDRPINVGVILMGGETEILDVAPVDMLNGVSKHFIEGFSGEELLSASMKAQAVDLRIYWVSEAGPATQSHLTSGIRLTPTDTFESCPPLDIVLIGASLLGYTPNAAELAFVRKSWEECSAFITICGGVDIPRQAGILEGKTATGPRFGLDIFRQLSPNTNWVEKRWVRDGKLWTSGALLNGTDLLCNFAKHYWGGSEDTLVGFVAKNAGWPDRDVDYKDEVKA